MRRRRRRTGYDSWQGNPTVMPPRDTVDAEAIAAIVAAEDAMVLCAMPPEPEQEAHNRRALADGIAAAGRMTGPNRAEWRRMYLRRLVTGFHNLTMSDPDAGHDECRKMLRDLGVSDSP